MQWDAFCDPYMKPADKICLNIYFINNPSFFCLPADNFQFSSTVLYSFLKLNPQKQNLRGQSSTLNVVVRYLNLGGKWKGLNTCPAQNPLRTHWSKDFQNKNQLSNNPHFERERKKVLDEGFAYQQYFCKGQFENEYTESQLWLKMVEVELQQ